MRANISQNIIKVNVSVNPQDRGNITVSPAGTNLIVTANIIQNAQVSNNAGYISAGASIFSLGTAIFSNSNGVSFGANGQTVTASINAGAGTVSAGGSSIALGEVVFSNSNSVSFGLNGSTLTASFSQTSQSQSSFVFSNSNNVSFGTNGSTVTASASFNQSSQSQSSVVFSNSNNVSFTLNGSTINASASFPVQSAYVFSNSNNVSFGTNGSTVTATVTVPAQTQFVLSNSNGVSFGTNGSTVTATVKTDYQSSGNYLTTAMASDAGSRFVNTSAGLNLTNISATFNSNSISLSVATGLTSQSNQAISAANGSFTFQTASFANSNGVSFSTGTQGIFATVQTNYLTTARSSNDAVGLNTALTGNGVAWTVNSSGISLNVPAYLTTAMVSDAGSNFVNTSAGLNLTNVSATFNSNSISISVVAGLTSQSNQAISASNGSFAFQTATFGNSNGVSFLTSNGSIVASVQPPVTLSYFQHQENIFTSLQIVVNQTMTVKPFIVPFNVSGSMGKIAVSLSASTNTSATTASANITFWMGIYSLNGSTLSLASSGSANNGFQWSQSASTTANTSVNGMREITAPINVNMTPGLYWLGAVISSATTYTGAVFTIYGNNVVAGAAGNALFSPIGGTQSYTAIPFMGLYTTGVSAGPATMGRTDIGFTGASMIERANIYFELLNMTL